MKKFIAALFFLAVTSALLPQDWVKNLPQDKLQNGNLTLPEIQKAFNDYWEAFNVVNGKYINASGEEVKAPGWKQFKRWEWKAGYLVDGQGNFPETSTAEEMIKYYDKFPESGKSTSGNWTNIGYNSTNGGYEGIGRVNCIAFHPSDNNTFWIGAPSGGLWRTTNGGSSWTVLTDNNTVLGVSAIAVTSNYASSNTIYIGTGDRDGGSAWSLGGGNTHDNEGIGVLKSTNGGTTWTSSLSFTPSQKIVVYDLLIDPSNNNNLIAATGNGIYETTNAGSSWSQITTNVCTDLEYKPGSSSTFYGAYLNAKYILKFTKSSTWSWTQPTLPGSSSYRTELAVSANNSNVVYAVTVNSGGGLEGIYKSTDSGASYSLIFNGSTSGNNLLGYNCDGSTSTGLGTYDLFITANPSNANEIYVGGINIWRSTNGGTSWAIKSVWSGTCGGTVSEVHADQHCCEFQNSSTVFIGNDGGIYKSTNSGTSWTDLSNNLTINQIYRMGISKQNSNEIIIGLQDNGTHLYSGGSWTMNSIMGGDGMECIIDPTNTNVQYGTFQYGDLRRTMNHWSSTTTITSGLSGVAAWVTPFVIDPNVNTTLYVGYQNVFKSTNQGTSWTQIGSLGGSSLVAIAVAPSNSNYIYAASQTVLNRTTNGGTSWTNITTGLPVTNGNITYLAVKNDDPNTVWVTIGGFNTDAVYRTTDGGSNWTNISTGLPSIPAMSIVQNIRNTSKVELYVAMFEGVYVKYGNSNWTAFKTGLPNVLCTELEIYYDNTTPSNCKIRVATFGRGIWESNIPVVDFAANNTLPPNVSTPVLIADLSTNSPTAWSWSFSPNTVTYTGGTSSASQNPIVLFTNPGAYSVTLTTTNAYGNDSETKTSYIHVGIPGLWTGNTSTDWNTSTNWHNHLLPTSSLGATINPLSTNWPVYTGNFNVGTQCATLAMNGNSEITVTGNLTIPSGKVLTCSGNSTINIGGDLINYGTFTPGSSLVKMNGNSNASLTGNITTNGSRTTTYAAGYSPWPGCYFDVLASGSNSITINSFDIHCSTTGSVNVEVWYASGTYVGKTSTPGAWTQLGTTQTVTGQGYNNPTSVNPGSGIAIPAGGSTGFFINCYSGTTGYFLFSYGNNSFSNADITINCGFVNNTVPVGSGGITGYSFNGTVYYSYVIQNSIPFWDVEINKSNALVSTNGNLIINNNLTIKPGAWFTNSTGNTINILGNALMAANSSGMASYIDYGTTTIVGTTTVQEYLSPDIWHFISPSVSGALSGVYTGIYLRTFDEATDSWNAYITSTTLPLLPMKGYSAWKSASSAIVNLTGQLNNGPQSIALTRNTTQTDQGWNLVGNPYPSALNWDASGWTKTNINNTIYYYSGAGELSNYHYYIGAGGETPGIGVNNGTKYIPSTQGFFIHASANGTVGVTNTARVHNTQAFYKDVSMNPTIRLMVSQGELSDETVIRFYEVSTDDFDGDFDAFKLYGDNVPQIYSVTVNQTELAVNTLPGYNDETIIPVGFIAPNINEYKINLTEFENFEPGTCLYLEDMTTGIIHKISESPEYTFTASPLEDYNRFRLHFGNPNAIGETIRYPIRIYSDNNEIYVLNLTPDQASVYVYDLMGRQVAEKQVNRENSAVINLQAETGYYLVRVQTGDQWITEKVFIK